VVDFASRERGRRRDLPGQPVSSALPRYAHALSADPGNARSFQSVGQILLGRAAEGVSLRSGGGFANRRFSPRIRTCILPVESTVREGRFAQATYPLLLAKVAQVGRGSWIPESLSGPFSVTTAVDPSTCPVI